MARPCLKYPHSFLLPPFIPPRRRCATPPFPPVNLPRSEFPRVQPILLPPAECPPRLEKAVRTVPAQIGTRATTVTPLAVAYNPRLVDALRRHLPPTLHNSSLPLLPPNHRPMSPVQKNTICHHGQGIVVQTKKRLPRILRKRELHFHRPRNMARSTGVSHVRPREASVDKDPPLKRFRRWPATHPLRPVTLLFSRQLLMTPDYTQLTKTQLHEPPGTIQRVAVTVVATQARRRILAFIPQARPDSLEVSCHSGHRLHSVPVHEQSLLMARSAT